MDVPVSHILVTTIMDHKTWTLVFVLEVVSGDSVESAPPVICATGFGLLEQLCSSNEPHQQHIVMLHTQAVSSPPVALSLLEHAKCFTNRTYRIFRTASGESACCHRVASPPSGASHRVQCVVVVMLTVCSLFYWTSGKRMFFRVSFCFYRLQFGTIDVLDTNSWHKVPL